MTTLPLNRRTLLAGAGGPAALLGSAAGQRELLHGSEKR